MVVWKTLISSFFTWMLSYSALDLVALDHGCSSKHFARSSFRSRSILFDMYNVHNNAYPFIGMNINGKCLSLPTNRNLVGKPR